VRALVGWVLGNKSVSVLAALLMIAGGALGATRLNQELLPEVDCP
jgi:multidrug efflux pump subunit AcrB